MSRTKPDKRCSHAGTCELFPKFALRSSLKVWTAAYCEGNFEQCARYRRSLSSQPVPPYLLPNGRELDPGVLGR